MAPFAHLLPWARSESFGTSGVAGASAEARDDQLRSSAPMEDFSLAAFLHTLDTRHSNISPTGAGLSVPLSHVDSQSSVPSSEHAPCEATEEPGASKRTESAEEKRRRQRETNLRAQRRFRERQRQRTASLESEVEALRHALTAAELEKHQLAAENTLLRAKMSSSGHTGESRASKAHVSYGEITPTESTRAIFSSAVLGQPHMADDSAPQSETSFHTLEVLGTALAEKVLRAEGFSDLEESSSRFRQALISCSFELYEHACTELSANGVLTESTERRLAAFVKTIVKHLRLNLTAISLCTQARVANWDMGEDTCRLYGDLMRRIVQQLQLTSAQKQLIVERSRSHAAKLENLFLERKTMVMEATVFQRHSPAATLLNFMKLVGSEQGCLSDSYRDLPESDERVSMAAFYKHSVQVNRMLGTLRSNFNAEHTLQYEYSLDLMSTVLTPFQSVLLLSEWYRNDYGQQTCIDLLGLSRTINWMVAQDNIKLKTHNAAA